MEKNKNKVKSKEVDHISAKEFSESLSETKDVNSDKKEVEKGNVLSTLEETQETLYVKILRPDAKPLVKVRESDAGFDVIAVEDFEILPNERAILPTGVAVCIPYGYYGQIHDRSSMAAKGIVVSGGVIDSEYRGEVRVILTNTKSFVREFEEIPFKNTKQDVETRIPDKSFKINRGNKIAQIVIHKIALPKIEIVKELPKSDRGSKGFGSSGK